MLSSRRELRWLWFDGAPAAYTNINTTENYNNIYTNITGYSMNGENKIPRIETVYIMNAHLKDNTTEKVNLFSRM